MIPALQNMLQKYQHSRVNYLFPAQPNPTNMFPSQPFMTTANLQDLGVFLSSWIFACVQLN